MKRKRRRQSCTPLIPTFSPRGEKGKNVNPSPGGRGAGVRAEKSLITRARSLRKKSTDAERLLWYHLRNRRMAGYKFKRQFIIGRYIVDFVCIDAKLVLELDGGQHGGQEQYDSKRTEFLESKGYRVIRFWNNDVLLRTGNVLEEVLSHLEDSHPLYGPIPKCKDIVVNDRDRIAALYSACLRGIF